MAESADVIREEMFPKLSDAQIARLATVGSRRTVMEGEVIFEPGVRRRSLFVVLNGRLEGTIPRKVKKSEAVEKAGYYGRSI